MKQINNGFKEFYYLTEEGEVWNNSRGIILKENNAGRHAYKLRCCDGKFRIITKKSLYKLVYNKVYCIDEIEDLEREEWREIEGSEGLYLVSNQGRVKSLSDYTAKILKTAKNHGGYDRVDIKIHGQRCNVLVSRCVAFAFLVQPTQEHIHLHHINGVKTDNRVENLIWLRPDDHRKIHQQMEQEKIKAAAAAAQEV